jgi:putative oxidoreductase
MLHRVAQRFGEPLVAWSPVVLRIIAGVIFVYAGWMKGGDMQATIENFAKMGFAAASFFAYLVTIVEIAGGIALIAGLWTRVAAKLLGITMIVAAIISFMAGGFGMAGFPLAMLAICFSLFTTGGGKYSMKD